MRRSADAEAVAIPYQRGMLLYLPCFVLGATVMACLGFSALLFNVLSPDDRELAWILSALLVAATGVVATVTVPLIRRFAGSAPAIVVSFEGLRTRDMRAVLPWDEIDKLTMSSVRAWAGRSTTVTDVLEIHPKVAGRASGKWLKLVDGHAHELRLACHVLARAERLADALRRHAPSALLARSDLSGLPGAERTAAARAVSATGRASAEAS